MKSQLMTTLSIVGVLGTATAAMAVNTDVLAGVDSPEIASATDSLLPEVSPTSSPDAVTATPAPGDPSTAPAPVNATQPVSDTGGVDATPVDNTEPVADVVTEPVVNGTTGGSGTPTSVSDDDDDDDDDEDYEDHDEDEEDDD